jgi:hypothetical protein
VQLAVTLAPAATLQFEFILHSGECCFWSLSAAGLSYLAVFYANCGGIKGGGMRGWPPNVIWYGTFGILNPMAGSFTVSTRASGAQPTSMLPLETGHTPCQYIVASSTGFEWHNLHYDSYAILSHSGFGIIHTYSPPVWTPQEIKLLNLAHQLSSHVSI